MSKYEGFFLLDNKESKADWSAMESLVTGLLQKHGCQVHSLEKWGERKLAYEIKRHRRGTYLLVHFEVEPDRLPELRRDMALSEKIVRNLILQLDEFPEISPEEPEEEASSEKAGSEKATATSEKATSEKATEEKPAATASPAAESPAEKAPAEESPEAGSSSEEASASEAEPKEAPAG